MKKIGVYVIIIIIAIVVAMFFKNITTTKYSHADIVDLINKGKHSMDNVKNLSYEKENKGITTKYYFKNGKKKMISEDNNNIAMTLEDGKTYIIDNKNKNMVIFTNESYLISNSLQEYALNIEKINNNSTHNNKYKYAFVYIRDEKIENKDCILVKECVFDYETKEYSDYYNSEKQTAIYWIEKSTGFVIGGAFMEFGNNTPTPQTIIKNIKFEEIEEDIFELPNGYDVLEMKDNGQVEKIK